MKKYFTSLVQSYHWFFLSMVFIIGIGLIFLIFPGESRFKYEFQKGSPWRHETLIAPFDFAIMKTEAEIKTENDSLLKKYRPYFTFDTLVGRSAINEFSVAISKFTESDEKIKSSDLFQELPGILDKIYKTGILQQSTDSYKELAGKSEIMVIKGQKAIKTPVAQLFSIKTAYSKLNDTIRALSGKLFPEFLKSVNISDFVVENLYYDEQLNRNEKKQLLDKLSATKGMVQAGERIIFQGDLVGQEKYMILESLKKTYETKRGDNIEYFLVIAGRLLIISIFIVMMFLYLLFYRRDIFDHKRKFTFIFMMIVLMVFMAGFASNVKAINIYMVP
ncbi:MAG: hypothetical protein Q7W54_15035, partial [Bacteroidota bacterium]|nr:hypothetical protein [Bacteroidota bacterium]